MESKVESQDTPSAAQAMLQVAAYRIDLRVDQLNSLTRRLDEEYITDLWQLNLMNSFDWQILGAPIGLVTSVRAMLAEVEDAKLSAKVIMSTSTEEERRVSDISTSFRESSHARLSSLMLRRKICQEPICQVFANRFSDITESFRDSKKFPELESIMLRRKIYAQENAIPKHSVRLGAGDALDRDIPPETAHRRCSHESKSLEPKGLNDSFKTRKSFDEQPQIAQRRSSHQTASTYGSGFAYEEYVDYVEEMMPISELPPPPSSSPQGPPVDSSPCPATRRLTDTSNASDATEDDATKLPEFSRARTTPVCNIKRPKPPMANRTPSDTPSFHQAKTATPDFAPTCARRRPTIKDFESHIPCDVFDLEGSETAGFA